MKIEVKLSVRYNIYLYVYYTYYVIFIVAFSDQCARFLLAKLSNCFAFDNQV